MAPASRQKNGFGGKVVFFAFACCCLAVLGAHLVEAAGKGRRDRDEPRERKKTEGTGGSRVEGSRGDREEERDHSGERRREQKPRKGAKSSSKQEASSELKNAKIKDEVPIHSEVQANSRMADPSFEPVDFNTAIQSPPMPLMLNLLAHGFGRGFVPEKRIRIVGTPLRNKADDQQFQVSLQTESSAASIPFHLNPRFNEKQNKYPWLQWLPFGRRSLVVRNNCVDGVWQREEGIGGFPFKVGAPFVLDLVARAGNKIEVFVDEKFYCDFCRVDLADISWMAVDGDLELRSVSLHNPNGFVVQNQKCPLDVHFSDIGLATGFVEPMCVRVTAADEQASPLEAAAANEFELAMLRRDGTSPFQVAINFGAGTVALRFQRLQPQLNDQGDSEVATTAPTEWLYQSSHFERGASPFTLELVAGPGHTVRTQLDGISIFADAPVQNLDAICRLRCTGPVQLGSLQIK